MLAQEAYSGLVIANRFTIVFHFLPMTRSL
ncbi:MAG: hypothetical protein OJF48_004418 [Afipia sp.]|jgi:hypothetical protein|nr:MAG: hypothetical protein OJF48_004418 [Afipia sp.]